MIRARRGLLVSPRPSRAIRTSSIRPDYRSAREIWSLTGLSRSSAPSTLRARDDGPLVLWHLGSHGPHDHGRPPALSLGVSETGKPPLKGVGLMITSCVGITAAPAPRYIGRNVPALLNERYCNPMPLSMGCRRGLWCDSVQAGGDLSTIKIEARRRPRSRTGPSFSQNLALAFAIVVPPVLYVLYVLHYSVNVPIADDWNVIKLAGAGILHAQRDI